MHSTLVHFFQKQLQPADAPPHHEHPHARNNKEAGDHVREQLGSADDRKAEEDAEQAQTEERRAEARGSTMVRLAALIKKEEHAVSITVSGYRRSMTQESVAFLETPIGFLRIAATEKGITEIVFVDGPEDASADAPKFLEECVSQLREYFDGARTAFDSLPLAVTGTEFQQKVWDVTSGVSYGETITYGDISKELHMNGGGQAVGSAMGRNPVCIIVPCHRVVPTSPAGSVGGYAGGPWRKEWLLALERANAK